MECNELTKLITVACVAAHLTRLAKLGRWPRRIIQVQRTKIFHLRLSSAMLLIQGFCTKPGVTRNSFYPAFPARAGSKSAVLLRITTRRGPDKRRVCWAHCPGPAISWSRVGRFSVYISPTRTLADRPLPYASWIPLFGAKDQHARDTPPSPGRGRLKCDERRTR